MSNKTVAVLFVTALAIVACTAEGPTTPPQTDTIARAPETTPTATPAPGAPTVVDPPATPDHDAVVTKGGAYSVTNTNGFRSFYCAAAFGVLPGGEQGAGTYLEGSQNQGERNDKDVFSGQFPKTAACQYKQIQGDLTQVKDCRNFTWNNVLAAAVWDNPDFIDSSTTETLPDEYTYLYSEGQDYEDWCGTRTKITWSVKKYRCSGQIVKTEKSRTVEEKECPCVPTLTPGQSDSDWSNWSSSDYGSQTKTCGTRTATRTFFTINSCTQEKLIVRTEPLTDTKTCKTCEDLNKPSYVQHTANFDWDTSGSDKNGVDSVYVRVNVNNAGSWKLQLQARQHTNDSWADKDDDTDVVSCGSSDKLEVSYGEHSWNYWRYIVYLNSVQQGSPVTFTHP